MPPTKCKGRHHENVAKNALLKTERARIKNTVSSNRADAILQNSLKLIWVLGLGNLKRVAAMTGKLKYEAQSILIKHYWLYTAQASK